MLGSLEFDVPLLGDAAWFYRREVCWVVGSQGVCFGDFTGPYRWALYWVAGLDNVNSLSVCELECLGIKAAGSVDW